MSIAERVVGDLIETRFAVGIPMRDGVTLRANVTRPAGDVAAPVLLMRSPYPLEAIRFETDVSGLSRRGFAVVVQSVRGTGASEGEFEPWVYERDDGYDSVEWCARQPWSTGAVAMLGGSYLAHTQLYAATAHPPSLRALALRVPPSDSYALTYSRGALALGSSLNWAMNMVGILIGRRAAHGEDVAAEFAEWRQAMDDLPALYRTVPLAEIPVLRKHFPSWRRWVEHPARDEYWQQRALAPRSAVPLFVVGGWYDVFLQGTLRVFEDAADGDSRLTVGPWSHSTAGQALGHLDYGFGAQPGARGIEVEMVDFLAAHTGIGPAVPRPKPVSVFVMGTNRWRDEAAWPVPHTELELFLTGGGRLSTQAPTADVDPSQFTFDPRDPVPTVGGSTLLPSGDGGSVTGACEQGVLDGRADILRFVTGALDKDVEVIGTVNVSLYAATSAADTDWTAKLVDVHPDGRAYNILDSIVRERFSEDEARAQPLPADEPHLFTIELGATAQTFLAGHRIRLDVSSSNFPRFDRNPGIGDATAPASEADFRVAHQRVFHDSARPSRISLPVVATSRARGGE